MPLPCCGFSSDTKKKTEEEVPDGLKTLQKRVQNRMNADLAEVDTGMISLNDATPENDFVEVDIPAGTLPGTIIHVPIPEGYPKAGNILEFEIKDDIPPEGGKVSVPIPR
eukprot:CAMPEP_0118935956 /NCGR_PEP_ID=MMETSP1169-20130426/15926_1 /TAXON_ID=36882 /ORGANISM="Pyramimonas obovata, Strain CCMP722" /LENGTH=109 /DNA_ID=CAMNT_0006879041 /DNA_START=122 /DNA_END=451 /DNA_ORIENTATION=+